MKGLEGEASPRDAWGKGGALSSRGAKAFSPMNRYRLAFNQAKSRPWGKHEPEGNIVTVVAENRLSTDLIHDRLATCSAAPEDVLCYPNSYSGTLRLREAVSSLMQRTFMKGVSVSPDCIIIQAGCGAILDNLFYVMGEAGQAVLIPTPCYPQFDKDLTVRSGMAPIPFRLYEDGAGSIEEQLEAAAAVAASSTGSTVCALLLTNPHNPCGTLYSRSTLLKILQWCLKNHVHVVSDEIYALSVWSSKEFGRFQSLEVIGREEAEQLEGGSQRLQELLHVVWGVSKDFSASGLRMGSLHTRNKAVLQAIDGLSYYTSVSVHTQHMLADLLEDAAWVDFFVKENAARIRASFSLLQGALEEVGIPFIQPSASLFCWLDLRESFQAKEGAGATWEDEDALWDELTEHGMYMTPGSVCHADEPGFFRMCFTWVPAEALPVAACRIRAAMDSFKAKRG